MIPGRPNGVPCENLCSSFIVALAAPGRKRKPGVQRLPRVVEQLERAVELGRLLDTGEVRFRADLARRSGVSAMRITQILALLKLAPELKEYVRALPAGTPERRVTERGLRALTGMAPAEQVGRAAKAITGFGVFLAARLSPAANSCVSELRDRRRTSCVGDGSLGGARERRIAPRPEPLAGVHPLQPLEAGSKQPHCAPRIRPLAGADLRGRT